MRIGQTATFIILIALLLGAPPGLIAAQAGWPNCENFLDKDDAQATYDADRQGDQFDLESSDPIDDDVCAQEDDFGTQPLISCDALDNYPSAQQALQGLYDHTRGEDDP